MLGKLGCLGLEESSRQAGMHGTSGECKASWDAWDFRRVLGRLGCMGLQDSARQAGMHGTSGECYAS